MNTLLDTFVAHYDTYPLGEIVMECEEGEIIFWKKTANPTNLAIFGLYVHPSRRNQGICRRLLQHLVDVGKQTKECEQVCVLSVLSKPLHEYLLRFRHQGCRFRLKYDGFYCRVN